MERQPRPRLEPGVDLPVPDGRTPAEAVAAQGHRQEREAVSVRSDVGGAERTEQHRVRERAVVDEVDASSGASGEGRGG